MFDTTTIILIICLYVGFLFLIAMWIERRTAKNKKQRSNAIIYSLSLAIYCTSWTYYGSVGKAASSGMLFITIYLGPTLAIVIWWKVLRKLVRLKHTHRINSIADFIAARYNNSPFLAAIATIITFVGIAPYIALQLKAVSTTFAIITDIDMASNSWIGKNVEPVVVVLMIGFTIIFGVRRLDPTERHQGMVFAVAIESVVKLVSFLAVGIFVTYFLFDGFDDIFRQSSASPFYPPIGYEEDSTSFVVWTTYLVLATSAIMFLPRQFHIAVIENSHEKDIKTAIWLFPLYMFLINIFVLPIAMGGIIKGLPLGEADTYVLGLPLRYGDPWLILLAFIGGFSAATSMIMISAMTMATMMTNHLMLPCIDLVKRLHFLKRHILKARWIAVTLVVTSGYWFEQKLGGSFTLVNMGMISFAAALQFAPSVLGGIFWRRGNQAGAILGLCMGFLLWFYTLLIPSFSKSGWISSDLLNYGPANIDLLRPEQLFGLTGLDPLSHAVFWTVCFNIGFYFLGSLFFRESEAERKIAHAFVDVLATEATPSPTGYQKSDIQLINKKKQLLILLKSYFSKLDAELMVTKCLASMGITKDRKVSALELAEICSKLEKTLAGAVGTTEAHKTFKSAKIFSSEEFEKLTASYGEILADLRIKPNDLRKKINYHKEREVMVTSHAEALELKVKELQIQISERILAETALKKANDEMEHRVDERTDDLNQSLITLKHVQQQLIRSERLAALSNMVTGVAHEINTPLGIGVTDASFLHEKVVEISALFDSKTLTESQFKNKLQLMLDSSQSILKNLSRSADLISNFKQVAVDQITTEQREFNILEYINGVLLSLKTKLKKTKHTITIDCQDKLMINSYPGAFAQIITNFIMNSLIHGFEGIETGEIKLEIEFVDQHLNFRYSDNGNGMNEETLNQVFDPFFTTKRNRGSLGLGLNIVYNIVTQKLNGQISCVSQSGKGIEFLLELPLVNPSPSE